MTEGIQVSDIIVIVDIVMVVGMIDGASTSSWYVRWIHL